MTKSFREFVSQKRVGTKMCETCANLVPLGDGDHICDACFVDSLPAFVICEYEPTEDYMACNGRMWLGSTE